MGKPSPTVLAVQLIAVLLLNACGAAAPSTAKTLKVGVVVETGGDLIITVGFRFADATAKVAHANPNVRFAIMDSA